MGGNHAGFIENAGLQLYYSATGSYVSDGSISSYFWLFEGGTPSFYSGATPGNVSYPSGGYFTTSLLITSNAGKTSTGTRHVLIFNPRENGAQPQPFEQWGVNNLEGSREMGGWSADLWVRDSAAQADIVDGTVVVLFTKSWEGGTETKLGAGAVGRDNILFAGYVQEGTIRRNYVDSFVEFRAVSITGRMKTLSTYAGTLESKAGPSTWNEAAQLTPSKSVELFLKEQSTVMNIADVFPVPGSEGSLRNQYADFARGNLYESVNAFYQNAQLAQMVSDRQGRIHAEIELSLQITGSRVPPTALEASRMDWRDEIRISEHQTPSYAYVELNGIQYSGNSTGTSGPFIASAPGNPAGYFGEVMRRSGLVLDGQPYLNTKASLMYNHLNARYPRVDMPMAGDYRLIDIAPQQRILLTMSASETKRGIAWTRKSFYPQEIRYNYSPELNSLLMDVGLTEETASGAVAVGRTIEYPEEPEYGDPAFPQWEVPDFPDFQLPPFGLPDFPVPQPPPVDANAVYLLFEASQIYKTSNFSAASPTWTALQTSWSYGDGGPMGGISFDPFNAQVAVTWENYIGNLPEGIIYYTDGLLGTATLTWSEIMSAATANAAAGVTIENMLDVKFSKISAGTIYAIGRRNITAFVEQVYFFKTTNYGATWTATIMPDTSTAHSRYYMRVSDDDSTIYVLDNAYVWASTNSGNSFSRPLLDMGGGTLRFSDAIIFDHLANSVLWIAQTDGSSTPTVTPNIMRYTVNGFTSTNPLPVYFGNLLWAPFPHWGGTTAPLIPTPQFARTQDGSIIVGVFAEANQSFPDRMLMKSTNNGVTWTVLKFFIDDGTLDGPVYSPVILNTNDIDEMVMWVRIGGVWRPFYSGDGGVNWVNKTGNLPAGTLNEGYAPIHVARGL
jgi:hypothetical protein